MTRLFIGENGEKLGDTDPAGLLNQGQVGFARVLYGGQDLLPDWAHDASVVLATPRIHKRILIFLTALLTPPPLDP